MSFASYELDKIYPFAPFEEIRDEHEWNELIRLWKPIDWSQYREDDDTTNLMATSACEGPACLIDRQSVVPVG
jgi:hypothetical protein